MLVVAVGISAGVGALVSAFSDLQPHTLSLCLAILLFITLVNLRGVRESGLAFMAPTYLFIVSLLAVIAIGLFKTVLAGGHPVPVARAADFVQCHDGGESLDSDARVCERLYGDDRC